jgi:hypothetical protein
MAIDWFGVAKEIHTAHVGAMKSGDEHGINAMRLRDLLRDIGDILDTHAAGRATAQSIVADLREAVGRITE